MLQSLKKIMCFYDFEFKLLLQHFGDQMQAKRLVFIKKTCIKARLEIEKSQVVCCRHLHNSYFLLNRINDPLCYCPQMSHWDYWMKKTSLMKELRSKNRLETDALFFCIKKRTSLYVLHITKGKELKQKLDDVWKSSWPYFSQLQYISY